MGRSLVAGLALGALGALVLACNALTGASELALCEGAACETDPGTSSGGPDGAPDGATTTGDGSTLPDVCREGQKACEGKTAATCLGTAWSRTPCAETCIDGACTPWPSCRNAAGTGCGATRSCCETSPVPAGTFNRRNDPTTPATVSAFALESFEVTVGRFRSFVAAGGGSRVAPPAAGAGAHPKIPGSGWQTAWNALLPADTATLQTNLQGGTWTASAGANEHKPIDNVPWLVAFAFCAADGARLPTNAEWSYAAAGGSEQRVYPWSSPPSSAAISRVNAAYQCGFALPAESCGASVCSVGGSSPCDAAQCSSLGGSCTPPCTGCDMSLDLAPVGSLPAGVGRYGQFDLGGNVAELVLDVVNRKGSNALPMPCADCALLMPATPTPGGQNESGVYNLGGAWNSAPAALRTDAFTSPRFTDRSINVGFRCARD